MVCETVTLNGTTAIVCGRGHRPIKCSVCGAAGDRLCDWKIGSGRTCDKPLCSGCSTKPARGKDLCPAHAKALEEHQRQRTLL